jgi:hypothetical protein
MKLVKTASGKRQIKISKKEWMDIGKTAGWMKEAQYEDATPYLMRSSKEDWEKYDPNDYADGYYLVNDLDERLIGGPFENEIQAIEAKKRNINPDDVSIVVKGL